MKYFIATLIVVILGAIVGCSPTAPANEKSVETPPKDVKEFSLTLLPGPWEKYLSAPPKILPLTHSTKGIQDLLSEEQLLIKSVLDADASVTETSEHSGLQDRLEELTHL